MISWTIYRTSCLGRKCLRIARQLVGKESQHGCLTIGSSRDLCNKKNIQGYLEFAARVSRLFWCTHDVSDDMEWKGA